jgi:hypothetical protein
LQPLLWALLVLTWCTGDSLPERFETARAFAVAGRPKRRRPGRTFAGFALALAGLPLVVLRAVAAGLRRQLARRFELEHDGFVVLGCDGSRLECPRSAELERRLPTAGKGGTGGTAPGVWLTALVHLRSGLLWSWRLGKADASERDHLRRLLPTLPARALVVADAGFSGYELARALVAAGASFLIRASGKDYLYVENDPPGRDFRDGEVLLWPKTAREQGWPPLQVRLLRIRGKGKRDVWLLSDVRDSRRLSVAAASQYYRWRWENEGLFRSYKRGLAKLKLQSRSVRLVHREAEGSLLALQLLLALGASAVGVGVREASARRQGPSPESAGRDGPTPARCSVRQVLLGIRAGVAETIGGGLGRRGRSEYARRLREARRQSRARKTAKEKRQWPRRARHQPPKRPHFLTLTDDQKALLAKLQRRVA